jgi:hypothetical protein
MSLARVKAMRHPLDLRHLHVQGRRLPGGSGVGSRCLSCVISAHTYKPTTPDPFSSPSFLHAIREGQLEDYVIKAGGAEKVLHFGSNVTRKLERPLSFQEGTNQYSIALERTDADQLYPSGHA